MLFFVLALCKMACLLKQIKSARRNDTKLIYLKNTDKNWQWSWSGETKRKRVRGSSWCFVLNKKKRNFSYCFFNFDFDGANFISFSFKKTPNRSVRDWQTRIAFCIFFLPAAAEGRNKLNGKQKQKNRYRGKLTADNRNDNSKYYLFDNKNEILKIYLLYHMVLWFIQINFFSK